MLFRSENHEEWFVKQSCTLDESREKVRTLVGLRDRRAPREDGVTSLEERRETRSVGVPYDVPCVGSEHVEMTGLVAVVVENALYFLGAVDDALVHGSDATPVGSLRFQRARERPADDGR